MKFVLAGTGINISLEGGSVSVGYEKTDDIMDKTVGPIMVPMASGLGIVMSASLKAGVTAGGKVTADMTEEVMTPPMEPEVLRETALFGGSLEFKIGIVGEVFFGVGAGVQAANIATGIAGSLELSVRPSVHTVARGGIAR